MKYIIDTNVPMKAANMNIRDELDAKCSYACLEFIRHIIETNDTIVVLDSGKEILREYRNNLNSGGQIQSQRFS